MFRFYNPYWLVLLVIPIGIFIFSILFKGLSDATIPFPNTLLLKRLDSGRGYFKRLLSLFLAVQAISFLILAMARPQSGATMQSRNEQGIDIVMALDISSSMEAMDFDPLTRLEAAKKVITEFVKKRKSDKIGLVVFSAYSVTLCPLTLDYDMLVDFLSHTEESRIEDGTAIGSAIATSVNRLQKSEAKSRIIILLTDGMNNRGNLDPVTAAKLAQTLGIRVYTIGVGTEGQSLMKIDGRVVPVETHIDENTLIEVARMTGGNYYRAKNTEELEGIYDAIDKLETSKIHYDEWVEYNDLYPDFMQFGLFLLVLSFIMDLTLLRRIP